jgi:hypothetical protein
VSIDKIQSGIDWSEGNTAWDYRGNASVFLGQEIEHWIEFGSVHRFRQRKPENEKGYPTHRLIVARFIYLIGLCPSKSENNLKGKPFDFFIFIYHAKSKSLEYTNISR